MRSKGVCAHAIALSTRMQAIPHLGWVRGDLAAAGISFDVLSLVEVP